MISVPESLGWLAWSSDGRAWLESLPDLVATCATRWRLRLREPFPDAYESLVVPAERKDDGRVVLRVQFPNREGEHGADALRLRDGDGAVRLLDHDPAREAFLLERCEPGTSLSNLAQDNALDVMAELLPRLWKPAGEPFRRLEDEAARLASSLPEQWERAGRPFGRDLLDAALGELAELPRSTPPSSERVLLHQDLHADNVLRARREPWLVIDPKPLAGEREFGLAPLVRGPELGVGRAAVLHRLDRLTEDLGLDRDRARRWTIAQSVAWSFEEEGSVHRDHVDCARWLLEAG